MPRHDLIVIGAGPGGYVAAIRAAQLGLSVGIVERERALGGTCLRVGCIPSKALLESSDRYHRARTDLAGHGIRVAGVELDLATMLTRKTEVVTGLTDGVAALLAKNKVARYAGHARFAGRTGSGEHRVAIVGEGNGAAGTELEAARVIIATGSKVAPLAGVVPDGDRIGTSTEALSYAQPPAHLVVIGAGYIGLELGSVWHRLGSKVTVLEYLPRILPGMDAELADLALRVFKKQGLEFRLSCRVKGARVERPAAAGAGRQGGGRAPAVGTADEAACFVEFETAEGGAMESVQADRVLLAVGRVPNTDSLELESIGVQTDSRGRITVDDQFATTTPGVYAIGDVIRGPMLAHKAEDEGVACAEIIATGQGHVNYDAIPGVVYTNPEIAAVGKTEEDLKHAGIEYRKGVFHFRANARARAVSETEGRVKILANAKTDRILGVHIIGPHAGDLIAEAAVAIEFGASSEDLARSSHAHPTLAEALKEAALAVGGRAIHA